jgi:hypothetical protein
VVFKPVQENQSPAGPAVGRRVGRLEITILGPERTVRADGVLQVDFLTRDQRFLFIQAPEVLRGETLSFDQFFDDQSAPAEEFFLVSWFEIIAERPADIVLKIYFGRHGVSG